LTYQSQLMYDPAMTTNPDDDQSLLLRFQAVAEETRFGIVKKLAGGERCVCELQDELDAAQSRLSFHLKKLKDAGVVTDTRRGRWVYYALVPEALEEMRAFLGEVRPPEGALTIVGANGSGSCECGRPGWRAGEPCC
jgi:ArsR family transcriptional regulator, arsenate/arsenite/antimonite-responsive transcriptional repressor